MTTEIGIIGVAEPFVQGRIDRAQLQRELAEGGIPSRPAPGPGHVFFGGATIGDWIANRGRRSTRGPHGVDLVYCFSLLN